MAHSRSLKHFLVWTSNKFHAPATCCPLTLLPSQLSPPDSTSLRAYVRVTNQGKNYEVEVGPYRL